VALLALCALRACSASGVWDDIGEEEEFRDFEGARVLGARILGASAGGSMGTPTTPPPPTTTTTAAPTLKPTPSLHAQIHYNGTCDDGANALTSAECTLYAAESNLKRNTGLVRSQYRNIYPAGPFGQVR
jgi:hypothetical protein